MSGLLPKPVAVGPARAERHDPAAERNGPGASAPPGLKCDVRPATHLDLPGVVEAVRELLRELGATPPATPAMLTAARALFDSPDAGALLVADTDSAGADAQARAIVGVLGASWQTAIHIPGRYALIQDLWVHPAWRGRAVGADLLSALFERAREQGLARVEVGLPSERFPGLAATQAFYAASGFVLLGPRMRRGLP
jgi:GNAT superfamily N-acetyltransferase